MKLWAVIRISFDPSDADAAVMERHWEVARLFHDKDFAALWIKKNGRPQTEYNPKVECGPFYHMQEVELERF